MKKGREKKHRICAAFLCVCMLLSLPGISDIFPVVAAAEQAESFREKNIITTFDPLPEDIKVQTVFVGTDRDELDLPEELTVCLLRESSEQKAEESGQENTGETDNIEENSDTEIENEQPEEIEETTATETEYTIDIEDKEDGAGESVPVEEQGKSETEQESTPSEERQESASAQETHTVTMQEYHAENVISVQTLENTQTEKQEETVAIDSVTWQSEPEYDGSTEGIYTFTAVLPEGYALAEGVSLPQITVTVKESESGTDFAIQILLDRIAALPDAEEYLALEPDMEEDEDAYAEWEEKLYEYAEEALAIWEEYKTLTEEQQARMPEEELTKLKAWVEVAETLSDNNAVMLAAYSEHHGESNWTPLTTSHTTLSGGKFYLSDENGDLTMGTITIDGDVTLCLNGHKLQHDSTDGSAIVVTSGTFTLCDCQDHWDYTSSFDESSKTYSCEVTGQGGCIIGGNGNNSQGGGVYVTGANTVFNMNSGRITGGDVGEGEGHYGGGVCVTGGTFNMSGGFIDGNKAWNGGGVALRDRAEFTMSGNATVINNEGDGGGVDIVTSTFNMTSGNILGNKGIRAGGGGIMIGGSPESPASFIMSGGMIEGNTMKSAVQSIVAGIYCNGGTMILSGGTIQHNIGNTEAAGGIRLLAGTLEVSGNIRISDNYGWNGANNLSLARNCTITVTGGLSNDIGVTWRPARGVLSYPVIIAHGTASHPISDADWSHFSSDNENYEIQKKETTDTGNELYLAEPGKCNLFDLTTDGATLSPSFDPNTTEYTSTVANSVNQVDITATLADASTATIKIKINDDEEVKMTSGTEETVGLNVGKNTIVITVTSDGMSKTYTIEITKEANANYTVTYNGNGSTGGSTEDSSHTYGTAKALTANGFKREYTVIFNPNDTGSSSTNKTAAYTFAGWNTEADGSGTPYDDKASVENLTETNNGTVTLYAQWTPASVTYTPTREGYTFAGWYTDASCSGSRVDSDGTYTPTKDMTLYAKWTPIKYTISYNLDGGTVTGNPTEYTIESRVITLKNPTKEGYTFTGWSGTDLTGSNHMSVTIAPGSIGHRTYTANWELKGYTVTLHTNGGTGGTDLTSYKFGTGAVLPTDWQKTGYVFDGWYENESFTGTTVTNISGTATGDKEYWAKWTDNIAPVIGTLTYNYQPKNFWHWLIGKDSLIITVPVTEEGSGADKITYTVTPVGGTAKVETATIQNGAAKITVSADFKGTISIVCTDKSNNTSAGVTVGAGLGANGIIIEDNAPEIAFLAENAELLPSGEYKTVPNIAVTVTDDKDNAISGGIASISYKIGNGSEKTVAHDYTTSMVVHDSFTIPASEIPAGETVISVTATDNAGNSTTETYIVKVHIHSGTLVPAVAPTCTTAGNKEYYTCTCGKYFSDSGCTNEITDKSSVTISVIGHDFSGEYLFDTAGHWKKCSRCAETTPREVHHFGADGTQCTVCDYEKEGQGHTHRGELHAATAPTCITKGNAAYYTCNCGRWFSDSGCTNEITDKSTVEIAALGHDFSGQYSFHENGHWKVCSRCSMAQTSENHVFDDDNDTTCNKCDYQRTIGAHTHSAGRTVAATEPTCTTAGNKEYHICSCGKWFLDSACTKEVTAQDVTIPAKGHTAVTDPAKAATCTETGRTEGSHCTVCGHVIKAQTVTMALGHDYGNYDFDAEGHWKVCRRCGAADAKHDHNYDNNRDTKCSDCDWVRESSDNEQDEQPIPTPAPEPSVSPQPADTPQPTPQAPAPTDPPTPTPSLTDPQEQPQPTGTPEPTEETSGTGKEQQSEGDGGQTVPVFIDNGKIAMPGEPVATGNVKGMTDTSTVLNLGNGAVIVTVVCAEQEYTAGVADTIAVANAVLTSEQMELVNNGETIEIRIDVKDISDQVPEMDKEVIENGIEEYRKEVPGLVLGMYVDISIYMRIGGGDWNAIHTTNEPVGIILDVPDELAELTADFYIMRAHEGEYLLMGDLDEVPETITIQTEAFSTYAILYQMQEEAGEKAEAKCSLCHICPTFWGICYFIWLAIVILIMMIVIILLRKKKEEQDSQDARQ